MALKFNLRKAAKLGAGIAVCLLAGFISFSAAPSFAATVSYPQPFSTGWNLAGNSLTTPIDVKTSFGTQAGITTIWKWDAAGAKWAFYAPSLDTAGTLANYATTKGYSVLTTINQGEGFWVNASAPVSLGTASGTGFSLAASNLATGWNLSATGDSIAPAAFTTNAGNVTTLWAWDNANSAWYFYAPSLAANNTLTSYITSKNYKDFGVLTLDNGRGFWVNYAGAAAGGGTGGKTPASGLMGGTIQGTPLAFATALAQVTTFAGSGTAGAVDATGTAASFRTPQGITTDGTNLYVTDVFNRKIRKIVIATGAVTTLAGSGATGAADGTGAAASFSNPSGITTDGTNLYVTDNGSSTIRKIVIATGAVTTFAGTGTAGAVDATGTAASFSGPTGITSDGINLYVADGSNHKIRKIVIATGAVTTLAGSGTAGAVDDTGTVASFKYPSLITTDGASLYVTDWSNKIRKIVIATGAVSTLAGGGATTSGAVDGTGTAASFSGPTGITTDGTNLYVTDSGSKIRQIVISTAVVTTLAGGGGPGLYGAGSVDGISTAAAFLGSAGLTTDGANLYVVDQSSNKIRKVSATGGAPGGPTAPAALANITVTADSASQISINWVNVAGATAYNIYRSTSCSVQIIAGNKITTATQPTAGPYADSGLTAGTIYCYRVTAVNAVGESAGSTEQAAKTSGTAPPVVVVAPTVTPGSKSGGAVMGPLTLSGTVTPVTLSPALTMPPLTAALTTDGTSMYAYASTAASGSGIYKIDKASGATSLLATTSGTVSALTSDGIDVFVTVSTSVGGVIAGGIYRITPNGTVTSLLSSASLNFILPTGLAVVGNNLYFAVAGSAYIAGQREITKIDLTTKAVSTLTFGRNSCAGYMVCDGVGTNTAAGTGATFNWLGAMTTDGTYLYVLEAGDANPGIVRQISLADGSVKTLGGITRLLWANYASWMMGTGITTDGAGNVYVVNQATSQIIKYDIATNAASVVATGSVAGTNCASNKAPATCTGFHGGVTSDGTNLYTINGNLLVKIK